MLFENAADDGEPEPGALFARRHVGLEQPGAVLLGQADAVVDHVDDDVLAFALRADGNAAAAEFGRRHRADRFGGVLDDVGERLRNQPPIKCAPACSRRQFDVEIDVGMADAHQEHHLAHRFGHVLVGDDRLRHAGKARELVDHALDVVDLAHDGVGALLEHGGVFDDHLAVFAAQPFRRQLDRRQRVLDLVGDAAGDVGPGRRALREHQLGDVVDGDDVAVIGLGGLLAGDAHRKIALLTVAADRHLALDQPLIAAARRVEDLGEFGRDFGQRTAERLAFRHARSAVRPSG